MTSTLRAAIAASILTLPALAQASGEPSASYSSKLYRLTIAAGMSVMPSEDGGGDGYFADEEKAYQRRLAPVVREIGKVIDRATDKLGLRPYDPDALQIEGLVIEDSPAGKGKLRDADVEALKRWLELRERPAVMVFARAKVGKGGEHLTVQLAVNRQVKRSALDQLAAEVAAIIVRAPKPTDSGEAKGFQKLEPTEVTRPGLRLVVRPEPGVVEAAHLSGLQGAHAAYATRVEEIVVRTLRGEPELGLGADWPTAAQPPRDKSSPMFVMSTGAGRRDVVVEARLPQVIAPKLADAVRKKVTIALRPALP